MQMVRGRGVANVCVGEYVCEYVSSWRIRKLLQKGGGLQKIRLHLCLRISALVPPPISAWVLTAAPEPDGGAGEGPAPPDEAPPARPGPGNRAIGWGGGRVDFTAGRFPDPRDRGE